LRIILGAGDIEPAADGLLGRTGGASMSVPIASAGAGDLDEFESLMLLRIISQSRTIRRHLELFHLMQGDVQSFLPHEILISAWGDIRGGDHWFDVTSGLPGMRTDQLNGCNVGSLLTDLYTRWLEHGRQPLLLESGEMARLMPHALDCALKELLLKMQGTVVHGVHSARDRSDTLYVAASTCPMVPAGGLERFRRIVDLVIAQIDMAFRHVAGLEHLTREDRGVSTSGTDVLTNREREILSWVARGRTNVEISQILAISTFTVKNHVQRIIKKLGASNRTEAAASYRLGDLPAGARGGSTRALPVAGETGITGKPL